MPSPPPRHTHTSALSNPIRVHVFSNQGQRILYEEHFLRSLKDNWKIQYHPLSDTAAIDFGTQAFKRLILEKITILNREVFAAEEAQDYFIVADVDMQFFQSCDATVREKMVHHDFVLQSEHGSQGELNTGFMAMRATSRVRAIWDEVERRLRASLESANFVNEQGIINELLPKSGDLRWGRFPNEVWAYSNGALRPHHRGFNRILLHHANCTMPTADKSSLELKIMQLEEIRRQYYAHGSLFWYLQRATALIGRILRRL